MLPNLLPDQVHTCRYIQQEVHFLIAIKALLNKELLEPNKKLNVRFEIQNLIELESYCRQRNNLSQNYQQTSILG